MEVKWVKAEKGREEKRKDGVKCESERGDGQSSIPNLIRSWRNRNGMG
jgi:hypothetical protein